MNTAMDSSINQGFLDDFEECFISVLRITKTWCINHINLAAKTFLVMHVAMKRSPKSLTALNIFCLGLQFCPTIVSFYFFWPSPLFTLADIFCLNTWDPIKSFNKLDFPSPVLPSTIKFKWVSWLTSAGTSNSGSVQYLQHMRCCCLALDETI